MKLAQAINGLAGFLIPGLFALGMSTAGRAADPHVGKEAVQRALEGKAYWENKCDTVAGEKIYRKVENVEGVWLMKVRPEAGAREWADRNWAGAAFAREATGDEYIKTFLGYEYATGQLGRRELNPITPEHRGYISVTRNPGGLPGYRWVEDIDKGDGQRYRYTMAYKPRPTSKIGSIDSLLERNPVTTPLPRYGVTYEDHVIPEERYLGIASSTITVVDLKTKEVLGEMIRYAWSPGAPSRDNPSPWLTAYKCPGHAVGADAATRKFVDQVLIPAKAN